MQWQTLSDVTQIADLIATSYETPVLIFKHSTRCGVSSFVRNRFEDDWNFSKNEVTPVYLDLIRHRNVSNALAKEFNVQHESPQILLLINGDCVFHASHLSARVEALIPPLESAPQSL